MLPASSARVLAHATRGPLSVRQIRSEKLLDREAEPGADYCSFVGSHACLRARSRNASRGLDSASSMGSLAWHNISSISMGTMVRSTVGAEAETRVA